MTAANPTRNKALREAEGSSKAVEGASVKEQPQQINCNSMNAATNKTKQDKTRHDTTRQQSRQGRLRQKS